MRTSLSLAALALAAVALACRSTPHAEPTGTDSLLGKWESTDRINSFTAVLDVNRDGKCYHLMVAAIDGRYEADAGKLTLYDTHGVLAQQGRFSIAAQRLAFVHDDGSAFVAERLTISGTDSLVGIWKSSSQFALIQGYLRFRSDGQFSYRVQMPSFDLMPCRFAGSELIFDGNNPATRRARLVRGTLQLLDGAGSPDEFVRADWYPLLTASEFGALARALQTDGGVRDLHFPHL